jgi:ubiquinone/menaquinone biosynthesis C-methylase UbiE
VTIDYWDSTADTFDDQPDHGLRSPEVRAAWAARIRGWLPQQPSDVLDLGCGTGTLALLAAEQGHHVTAVDSSPHMAELARAKLAGTGARVLVGSVLWGRPVSDERYAAVIQVGPSPGPEPLP